MAVHKSAQGPGNLVPDVEFKTFKANGAIAKGEVVQFYGTTGYTVDQCDATSAPIGVAMEAIADGEWGKIQVAGHCDYVINDGTDVVAGDVLYAAAAGKVVGITLGDDQGVTAGRQVGIALEAETGTVCENVQLYRLI